MVSMQMNDTAWSISGGVGAMEELLRSVDYENRELPAGLILSDSRFTPEYIEKMAKEKENHYE